MDTGVKRSFDQMEGAPVEYVYSASDHHQLEELKFERPPFLPNHKTHDLNINVKMAALKVSSSVVSLLSFSGDDVLSQSCGTIIETEENNNIVITSLNLIRKAAEEEDFVENTLAENLKIIVRSSEKRSYIGEIYLCDFHYNLLILKFKSNTNLKPAKLGVIDDGVDVNTSFELRPHRSNVKPGDQVVVVGRYYYGHFGFMAASGHVSVDHRNPDEYGCRELFSVCCDFRRCGDGGALVNLLGEVVGIAFYQNRANSPFLPINIVRRWWTHYKRYKELRHPSYGFDAVNLYFAELLTVENVIATFPNISNGVLVEKVQPGSYAESTGLRDDDLILRCDGKSVKSFLELWDLMWDKVGSVVELEVARVDPCTLLSITMVVGEALPKEVNKWPRYD